MARDKVVTAWHCTVDKDSDTGAAAVSLEVVRESDGARANVTTCAASPGLDVAALTLDEPPWDGQWETPQFARLDRTTAGELTDCQAVGYPLFQRDDTDRQRNVAELHGAIRQLEDAASGFLLLRDEKLNDVHDPKRDMNIPTSVTGTDLKPGSAWGGLSGALVFHQGQALGVVVEHHPHQGGSAIRILLFERLTEATDPDAVAVARAIGLPSSPGPAVGGPGAG